MPIAFLPQCFRYRQHFIGARANPYVLGKVCPAHGAAGIQQKFRRTRDVMALRPCAFVQQVIAPDDLCAGIGEKSKCVAGFLAEIGGNRWWVHGNGHRTYARRRIFFQVFFNAS